MIKEPGETTRTCRIVLARPSSFLIKEPQLHLRSNGLNIEVVDGSGAVTSSRATDASAIRDAFNRDYLRIWSLFIQPNSLDGFDAKNLDPEPRGSQLFGVVMLSDMKRVGFGIRMVIDPTDRLPREMQILKPGSAEMIKVTVAEIKLDQDTAADLFGKKVDANVVSAAASDARVVQQSWEALMSASTRVYPTRTHVALTGPFPKQFTKDGGRECTITLLVNDKVSGRVDTTDKWQVLWVPDLGQLGKFTLRVQGRQGSQVVELGQCEVDIRADWPWAVQSAVVDISGAVILSLEQPLPQDVTRLTLSWNGLVTNAAALGSSIRIGSGRLVPGLVNLQGSLTRSDGSTFELAPRTVEVESLVTCSVPADTLTVSRATMEQTIEVGMAFKKPFAATKWTAWINGFAVATGRAAGDGISLPLEAVFDGKNDLVIEFTAGVASVFSAPVTVMATVDADVQRLRVSELMLAAIEKPVRRAVLLLAQGQKMTPKDDPTAMEVLEGIPLPAPGHWIEISEAIAGVNEIASLKPPITTDLRFNERAKELVSVAKGVVVSTQYAASNLAVAYGEAGLISRSKNLLLTLSEMVGALKTANGNTSNALDSLTTLVRFMSDFPPRTAVQFDRESMLLKRMAGDATLRYYHLLFLEDVRDLVAAIDDINRLDRLAKTIANLQGDAPFRERLKRAIEILKEVVGWKNEIRKLNQQIADLELAMARATSKEERESLGKKIGDLRGTASAKERQIRKQQEEAWRLIAEAATELGIDFTGVFDVAPK